MKTPAELRTRLKRKWEDATARETLLLGGKDAWPLVMVIGRPQPRTLVEDLDAVKRHVEQWRQVKTGEIVWESVRYRATSDPVEIPTGWKLLQPTDWIDVCADGAVKSEFDSMATLAAQTDPIFHPLLIRKRSIWREKDLNETIQAATLATILEPGCADNRPLRLLAEAGIDTKFFERNARLVTALLDVRFDGEVSRVGLECFLGAIASGDHWLLVIDLDGALLPFKKQRVRSSELAEITLPGQHLLIVENEACQHQLPNVPSAIAVLGAGFNLGWINAANLRGKRVGYWGDIDTWGLQFLAEARCRFSELHSLLMTAGIYEQHHHAAVAEPVTASVDVPPGLNRPEQALYRRLLRAPLGRLEQEFLPQALVENTITAWAQCCP